MEIKKLVCPSCGAALDWNSSACSYCNTELRIFEEEGSALPLNLNIKDIELNVIHSDMDFWDATYKAIDAPYSYLKDRKSDLHSGQDCKSLCMGKKMGPMFKMFFETYLIPPSETFAMFLVINDEIKCYALLTSIRMILFRQVQLLSIPLENFISWRKEESPSGVRVPVLRYLSSGVEKEIRFFECDGCYPEDVFLSITAFKEWEDLKPLQRNLITLSRFKLNKTYKIQLKPLDASDIATGGAKKGCFIATACYGEYDHPIVMELRCFRDSCLYTTLAGRAFVRWYYQWSPAFASFVAKSRILKTLARVLIVTPALIMARSFNKNAQNNHAKNKA